MAFLNDCSFIGNIGKDVEVKTFEGGGKVGNTSLAVTKQWKDKEGAKKEKTTWLNIEFPAHLVDGAAQFVTKGRQIHIKGELEIRDYDKDGVKHYAHSIRVDGYQLLGPKPEGASSEA